MSDAPSLTWSTIRSAIQELAVPRLYAACQPGAPIHSAGAFALRPEPPHPDAPAGSLGVTVDGLRNDPGLCAVATSRAPSGRSDRYEALVELLLRPMLRVFRTSLELCGLPWVDPSSSSVVFELTPERLATGRVVLTQIPSPRGETPARLEAIGGLAEAYAALLTTRPDQALDAVVAEELRHLPPDVARLLSADPLWAPYVHSVDGRDISVARNTLDRLHSLESERRSAGKRAEDAPVLCVSLAARHRPGFERFRREAFHLGAEVVEANGRTRADVVLPEVASFERAPHTWSSEPSGPRLSHLRSLAALPLAELREHPVGERRAVHVTWTQTTELVDRLAGAAKEAAARTAENAVAAHRGQQELPYAESVVRLVHHILHRKQFRIGSAANYPLEMARRDVLATIERGAPLQLLILNFPTKFPLAGLKAAGPMPDLAELGSMVRVCELTAALRAVYPPGAVFNLITDGEHFRPHPDLPLDDGIRMLRRYADLVGAHDLVLEDYEESVVRRIPPEVREAYADRRARIRRAYGTALDGLDVAADPTGALRAAATADPLGNFAELFKSLLYTVAPGIPVSVARTVYADPYDVGLDVPAEIRAHRQTLLAATWQDTLEYIATWHAGREFDYRRRIGPSDAIHCTVHARPGCLGVGLLGGAPIPPWQGTGVMDPRGFVSADFLVSLRDQGYVPMYSPLLGTGQPFAMVPVTATRARTDGGTELEPSFWASIGLRRR